MSDRRRLRWGVAGLGVGHHHALALHDNPNAHLVAVCDLDADVLASRTPAYPQASRYAEVSAMLDREELDAIVVATYDWDHAGAVISALDRGMHVFAEKPIATSTEDYLAVVDALRRNPNARLSTNTILRRYRRFEWLRQEVHRGALGRLTHMEAHYLYGRLPKLTGGWRGSSATYSVTLGGAIHMMDLAMWLATERPEMVMGVGSSAGIDLRDDSDRSAFHGHCLRQGLFTFPTGMTASISANFASVGPHFHRLDVFGTTGTFINFPAGPANGAGTAEGFAALLRGNDPGRVIPVPVKNQSVPKASLLNEFVAALTGGDGTPVSAQQAMDAVAACLALDDAVSQRTPVVIDYEDVPPGP